MTDVLAAVLSAIEEGVVIVGPKQKVEFANAAGVRLMTLEDRTLPATVVGDRFAKVCKIGRLTELLEEVALEGEEFRGEIGVKRGDIKRLHVAVVPVQLGSDRSGVAIALADRTDTWHLERVRQDFVANVSHELRTPIAAILGWSETLATGVVEVPERILEPLETIHRHAERLAALVNDLLALARAETIGIDTAFVRVGLNALIGEILASQDEALKARQIRVTVEIAPAAEVIHTEPRALEYVLKNLIQNAIRYNVEGGEIAIRAQIRKKGRLQLTVRDTGVGIDRHHLPRLFERFYRVDKGRSREFGGTGLGLSIVKHFVSALGGDVRVTSSPGDGTEFAVRLPQSAWEPPDGARPD